MAKNYPQPNWKNRVKMDRYLESKGLLNYQTKGQSRQQVQEQYQQAGIRLREGGQTGVNAVDNNVPAPTFNPQQPQRPRQAVSFNANPQGFTTPPNFGTPQNPTPAIPYEISADGLVVKVKLPQPVKTAGQFPTTEAAKNGNANWNDVSVADRKTVLSDPNFYKENKIMQYPEWMRNDILKDPSFDWNQLPKWQRPFYEVSSRPAAAGAVQGLVMGLGNPGGAVAGGVLGMAAAATGYDQNKEAWQQGDNKFTWDLQQLKDAGKGAFGYLNLLAEFAEKTIGTTAQVINAASDPTKNVTDYLNKETFNANASFFEAITPAIAAAQKGDGKLGIEDTARLLPALFESGVILDLLRNPEQYKGEERYLGAAMPVELEKSWTERLDQARAEIASGRNYREVMSEMQTGIMAQVGDMAGQGVFDPLNVMPQAETATVRKAAELSGNKVLAEAFTGVETPREGLQKFKNIVQTNEAVKFDPTFDAKNLNGFEKMIAGLNREGEIKAGGITSKGLLDPANPKKPAGGLFEETPQSRAQTGATLFDRNIGTLMTMFTDPAEAVGYIRKIAAGDMNVWKEMGSRVGNSPEWYTILPALKDFSAAKLEGLAKAWELTAVNRDALNRVADVLGDNATQLIDDWASRNNTDQDFARIIQRAKEANTPESKALLADFEAGKFTPDTLKQIVDIFHGEGALPHTEAQWKWAMYADLSDHFAEWVAKHLLLDKSPEATSAFFQTMGVLKQAQSIILLGASPGYAIQNGLSGIVHLVTDGIYGSMTPRQMDDWIARWETPIPRLDEGVGIGGMVDTVRGSAINDAVKGSGPLTEFKRTLSRIQRGMPMSKLSSKFESVNSKRGYITGLRKFWSQSWRRGVGFRTMEPALVKVLTEAGIEPSRIYAAIEAGANQKEIERALTGQYKGIQAQALINNAAQAAGVTHAQAADMLNKIGLTETLDTFLAGADTTDKVDAAFTRANQKVQDWIDMKYGESLRTRAEEVKTIVGREGMAAGLNVAQQASNQFYDAWFDHYARFGDVMGGLEGLEPAQRSKVIDEAYRQSDTNFRRVFASMGANYQGIFDVWGLSGDPDATSAVHAISDMNNSMKEAYDFMRQKRNDFSATLIREDRAPTGAELRELNTGIDKAFEKAFKAKHAAEVRMGEALKGVYTKLHGEAAGAAAKLWWNDVMKFSEKVVADEKKFRAEQDTARAMGASRADIADAKKKYYSENKQRWIADLQKINDEGIARLERIVKNKGGTSPTATTPAPMGPTQPGDAGTPAPASAPKRQTKAQEKAYRQQEEIRKMLADVEKIDAQERAERAAQVESVWNVAEGYWNRGGNYSRTTVQDRFALLNALKKPEYGGIPDLLGLHDSRLDAETVTRILDTRATIREMEKAKAEPPSIREIKKRQTKDSANVNILDAIRSYGGLNIAKITDYARDKKVGSMFGVFQKQAYSKGWDITDMATRLADDHFPIDLNDPNDPGGAAQTQALLDRALAGEQIYPTAHDYTADAEKINAAELAHMEALKADEAAFTVEPFDAEGWKARMQEAIATKDGEAVDTLFGELPEDLADSPHDADGETYAEYILRAQNNIEADAINDSRATAIATAKTEADAAVKASETRAEAVTTRTLMLESWTEIFGAEQAQTYMELSDAVAQWYERTTGQSADEFYSRYYEDARRSAEADVIGELEQSYRVGENVQNRTLSTEDAQNYARMLARSESEARSAVRNETNKADRIAILKALYEINPDMAENVARAEFDMLRQAESGVTWGEVYRNNRTLIIFDEAKGWQSTVAEIVITKKRSGGETYEVKGYGKAKGKYPDLEGVYEARTKEEAIAAAKEIGNRQAEGTGAKGAVTFGADGIKATIHAFEAADFSTLIHENAHVFRRVMKDVAERTGNKQVVKDLATIEEWAGVKGGEWTVPAEEKFARGFEKYIATGEAPTPRLRKAFDTFRGWMLQIYRTIKGSAIDVKISDEVRGVFDRLLGAEQSFEAITESGRRVGGRVESLPDGGAVINFADGGRNTFTALEVLAQGGIKEIQKMVNAAQKNVAESKGVNPLYQRNKAQVAAAQFDMFAESARMKDESGRMNAEGGRQIGGEGEAVNRVAQQYLESKGKQEWQLTRAEYGEYRSKFVSGMSANSARKTATLFHKDMVKAWLAQGLPVPSEVLAEYPDLQTTTDTGTAGGLLPGMQESTGMMFDVQPGTGSLTKMDAGTARTIYDIDPSKTAGEFKAGDIVQDADGRQHTVSGANMRSKIVTDKGRILDPKDVVRVAKQESLFQRTDPFQSADLPIGSIEEAGQQPPHHEAMNEGYMDYIRPLMEAMQKTAREQVQNKPLDGALRDLSPEGAAMLKKYRNQVNADMAGTKNAATKWGEQSRDFAMLNYNKRYGIDRYIETIYPYQFFYTRSLATWAARALDKPAIFSQYARIKRQQDRYERDIPERLRGKIKISLPWLPDWMGDALYIDPMRTLFTPLNYARPFERMMQDNSYQQIEAERILQEWASDGTVSAADITDAMKNREGKTWERAYAEAQIRRESEIQNPMDFMNTMLGPAWYVTTPVKLLMGKGAEVGSTPILNTTRAVDAVTQGTWAQPIGDLIGMIGKPEEMIRQKLNMPEFGEYGDYYVDRTLANMVADGILTSDQAQQAMIERKGAIFDQARERVKMELAMRVPTASALLAGLTAENFGQGIARMAMTAPVSLFGAGILPSGELEYRGLKQEWNEAWKKKDMGDDKAITQFFDDHPEYEAYLSKGKKPEERLRGYLVGQIWDGYMALGTTDRKQAGAEMGEEFKRSFLDSETRSYETLSVDQLAQWAQMLNQNVPQTELTQPTLDNPAPQIDYFAPEITQVTDGYFADRADKFPNYYTEQTAYFNIPETDRSGRYKYLAAHPKLKEYWDWNKGWKTSYPELEPVFSGKVFKRIDTSGWPMGLSDYVMMYAYTGEPMPKGARKALEQEWLREGKPMDDLQSWLDGQVAPALLYGGPQQ